MKLTTRCMENEQLGQQLAKQNEEVHVDSLGWDWRQLIYEPNHYNNTSQRIFTLELLIAHKSEAEDSCRYFDLILNSVI